MNLNELKFNILRKINDKSISQRKLAKEFGFSLGKINYCINELKKKGFVKLKNFKNNKNKISYVYLLTPKGISLKTKYAIKFLNEKLKEYEEIKKELDRK